jgi:hypothetical protein
MSGNGSQRYSFVTKFPHDWIEIGVCSVGFSSSGLTCCRCPSSTRIRSQVATLRSGRSKFATTSLVSFEGRFGALADPFGFILCNRSQDVDRKIVGTGLIAGKELDACFHETTQEVDVTGQPVELGDDKCGFGSSGMSNRLCQLWSLRPLAGLDFDVRFEDLCSMSVGELTDGGFLAFEPKSRLGLF